MYKPIAKWTKPKPKPKKLASITAHNRYGIPRSALIYMLQNQFYFDKTYIRCLESYHIIRWKPMYFLSLIKEGTVTQEGVMYQIIYHGTNPTKIAKATGAETHLKLSFRVAVNEFNTQPTVLVKLYNRSNGRVSE